MVLLKVKPLYIYFNSQDHQQTKPSIIASLLKQLLSALSEVPFSIQDGFHKFECGEWASDSAAAFIGFIKTVSTKFSCVAVLLDAFDECHSDEQPHIIDMITELRKSGIKIYITTRQHCLNDLKDKLKKAVLTEIVAHEEDIKMFMENKMSFKNVDDKLKDTITTTICPQAKGMYASLSSTDRLNIVGFSWRSFN